jgi:hypothetical protein
VDPKLTTIKKNVDIESVDVPTMRAMSDDEYRDFLRRGGLMYVDHRGALRSSPAAYPIAATRQQLDVLIEELQRLRDKLHPNDHRQV